MDSLPAEPQRKPLLCLEITLNICHRKTIFNSTTCFITARIFFLPGNSDHLLFFIKAKSIFHLCCGSVKKECLLKVDAYMFYCFRSVISLICLLLSISKVCSLNYHTRCQLSRLLSPTSILLHSDIQIIF